MHWSLNENFNYASLGLTVARVSFNASFSNLYPHGIYREEPLRINRNLSAMDDSLFLSLFQLDILPGEDAFYSTDLLRCATDHRVWFGFDLTVSELTNKTSKQTNLITLHIDRKILKSI